MSKEKLDVGQSLDSEKIQITKEGLSDIKKRLEHLIQVSRPEILVELAEARQQGDLSENADYDAAKNKQAEIEAEISKLQDVMTKAVVISENHTTNIKIGSVVEFSNEKGEKKKIKIVGPIQVDPSAEIPMIGTNTPIVRALMGKKSGDEVKVESNKPYRIKILKVI